MKKKTKKAAKRAVKKYPKAAICALVIFVVLIAAVIAFCVIRPDLAHKIKLTDHNWGDWDVEKQACVNDGKQSRKCEWCSEVETEIIPATGKHVWGEWTDITEASCGDAGSHTHKCTVCNFVQTESIPATGEHTLNSDGVCTVCGYGSSSGSAEEVAEAELSIHFLELGNKYTGDCTLIKYGDTEVLIDAGSRQNSAVAIKNYVDRYCTDGVLEYVIATHAHQDHIAGFVGSKSGNARTGILYQYEIGTLIQFAGTNATTAIYKSYCEAVEYVKGKGTNVYTAKQCWYETDGAKKQYFLDEDNKISLNILYQKYYEETTKDENDYSVCMLLTQVTGNNTYNYLFTGDLEEEGESSLVDSNSLPEVELFKGGHHGSYTATTEKLLRVIKPKNVAVCCCCGSPEYTQEPDNTFPAQAFLDRVAKYTENIYCTTLATDLLDLNSSGKFPDKTSFNYTSMNGNIVFYTVGGKLKLYCSNNDTILKDTEWFKKYRTWNP